MACDRGLVEWKRRGSAVTVIQEVLLELERDYLGHPYYVTGHAIYNELARRVDAETRRALHVSTGQFVPGEYGSYPDWHSQSGGVPYMGTGLRPVEAYEDVFLFRDAAQRWLLESRPRDAHNVHEVRTHGDRVAFAPSKVFGRPPSARNSKRTMTWYVHCFLHAGRDGTDGGQGRRSSGDGGDRVGGRGEGGGAGWEPSGRACGGVLPLSDDVLDGLRLGGARNRGFGATSLQASQTFELEALDFSRVRGADAHRIELVSPYVLSTEHPDADDGPVPWWWGTDTSAGQGSGGLRRREERLVSGADTYRVKTVDHGQVVAYTGDDPVGTAVNGVLRVGRIPDSGSVRFVCGRRVRMGVWSVSVQWVVSEGCMSSGVVEWVL